MGLLSNLASQALFTSILIGTLKRQGIISVDASKVKNETARFVLLNTVLLGEIIAEQGEKAYGAIMEQIKKN